MKNGIGLCCLVSNYRMSSTLSRQVSCFKIGLQRIFFRETISDWARFMSLPS